MNKSIALLSVTVLLFGMFVVPGVYADEIISITVDLQTILLDADEVIPLLNTNSIANMSKVTVSATLPCNSSDVPDLKITAGVLGNTTDVIDSSSDYESLRGPFDTCYFEDTVDIDTASVPALNRIFLTNDGTSSVLTGLGTTVSITGIIPTTASEPPSSLLFELNGGTTQIGLTASTVRGFYAQLQTGHSLIGETMNEFHVQYNVAGTGTIHAGVWNTSGTLQVSCGTADASTVSTTDWTEFVCSTDYVLQNGDRIGSYLDGSDTALKQLRSHVDNDTGITGSYSEGTPTFQAAGDIQELNIKVFGP